MTEPVAYLVSQEPLSSVRWVSKDKPIGVDDKQITPLYTAEQLHPRVKMTQAEFDDFEKLFETTDYASIAIGRITSVGSDFNHLKNKIFSGSVNNRVKNENEFNILWAIYHPDNPEETIEIVPDMKWFVRVDSQIPLPNQNIYLDDELIVYPHYDSPKSCAHQFDTKEEAEKWTNPLTEAVQLPVEGE